MFTSIREQTRATEGATSKKDKRVLLVQEQTRHKGILSTRAHLIENKPAKIYSSNLGVLPLWKSERAKSKSYASKAVRGREGHGVAKKGEHLLLRSSGRPFLSQ
jgi:hypothetical protein